MFEAKSCDDIPDSLSQAIEHIDQCLSGLLEIAWDEVFKPHGLRLVCGFNLCGNARMTGPKLAVTADRTADRDHWQSPERDSICTKAHQLDRVSCRSYAAIRPDFDFS